MDEREQFLRIRLEVVAKRMILEHRHLKFELDRMFIALKPRGLIAVNQWRGSAQGTWNTFDESEICY